VVDEPCWLVDGADSLAGFVGSDVAGEYALSGSADAWTGRCDDLVYCFVWIFECCELPWALYREDLSSSPYHRCTEASILLEAGAACRGVGDGNACFEFPAPIEPVGCYTTGTVTLDRGSLREAKVALDKSEMLSKIQGAKTAAEVAELRVSYLGRKGSVTAQLKAVGAMAASDRAAAGKAANDLRVAIEGALGQREREVLSAGFKKSLSQPIDVTAPGVKPTIGHRHPVSVVLDDVVDVFWQMGYRVETEWYNFEALLVGGDHPARDMQDTFYLENGKLPRTHTSAVQIRYMERNRGNLPIRIIVPGKAYRNEDEDARHSWSFHQLEGLVVDEGISLADLKGTLEAMMKGVLGDNTSLRLRPNYFPYTEPSVEMDATCVICNGTGLVRTVRCHLCGGTGWLELGGAGMVHPQVLKNVGIDSSRYSGFAFGFGPERIATIKYQVGDVREFWRPNLKFLEQF
jgi:phenylalanyl-tRNA synthetase alpha chain